VSEQELSRSLKNKLDGDVIVLDDSLKIDRLSPEKNFGGFETKKLPIIIPELKLEEVDSLESFVNSPM
jgi:hypothetical protein